MSKTLDHDSFIDGVFYKAGAPVPPRKTAPVQVSEDLTDTMTIDELIDHFRNGKGPAGAAAIIDLLDNREASLTDLKAKLDAANSADTDAAQLIAEANKSRDDAIAELKRLEVERGNVASERDGAVKQIADLQKERDDLKQLLDEATATKATATKAK